MDGRAFLSAAQFMVRQPYPEHWRSATSRGYYALLHEAKSALERWGESAPPRDRVHRFVRNKFLGSNDPDAYAIGLILDHTGQRRNQADYELIGAAGFFNDDLARRTLKDVEKAIRLLDAIESDPVRRAEVIASLPKLP